MAPGTGCPTWARGHPFASNCCWTRRLGGGGVRFIQLPRDWDHHGNIKNEFRWCRRGGPGSDRASSRHRSGVAALKTTLVIWGRVESRSDARWPRATGTRPSHQGLLLGWPAAASRAASRMAVRDLGYNAVEWTVVDVHDLHATIAANVGVDSYKRLSLQQLSGARTSVSVSYPQNQSRPPRGRACRERGASKTVPG